MQEIKTVETHSSPTAVSRDWKRLEDVCDISGYQTQRWVTPWLATVGQAQKRKPLFILGRDESGEAAALLTLVTSPNGPVRVASYAGGSDSNINLPLVRPGVRFDAAAIRRLLAEAARSAGVDAFTLFNQPVEWRGAPHPMSPLPSQPSPSLLHSTTLDGDGNAFLARLSSDTRKRQRWRLRKLEESGPVTLLHARTPAEVTTVLNAFRQQKKTRLEAMGATGFGVDIAADFMQDAALTEEPGVELHALMAGDRMVAMYCGVVHAGAYHAMVNSYDPSPEIARASPGDVIIIRLLQTLSDRGLSWFDLGVGEGVYKGRWCERQHPLFDTIMGVSAKGKAYALAKSAKQRTKRQIKQSAWLWALAQKVRAGLGRGA